MTTYLWKSCSFGFPRVPFVNCRQFMYLVISLLVLRAGCGNWLYQFLIIAYLFTFPMTLFTISLCTRKPTPCSCLFSFPLEYTLWPPSVRISPEFFHLISHNPRMLHLYRSISCKRSSTLPAALRVLTFHVAMVMSSLPRGLARYLPSNRQWRDAPVVVTELSISFPLV